MKNSEMESIVREYKGGNKWVRIGVWAIAAGLGFFAASAGGLFNLWLTGFPWEGVPCPSWIVACLLVGLVYIAVGVCCVVFGTEPPGGGGKRKKKPRKSAMPIGALTA